MAPELRETAEAWLADDPDPATRAELQRVQWPDRRQVGQATAVVLGFVVIAGLYLGAADWVAGKLVDLIL